LRNAFYRRLAHVPAPEIVKREALQNKRMQRPDSPRVIDGDRPDDRDTTT
jgi:hypothetical protein